MTRPYLRERRAQRIAEGQQDMLNRCGFCKRELPKTGGFMRFRDLRSFCSEDCAKDDDERTALMEAKR